MINKPKVSRPYGPGAPGGGVGVQATRNIQAFWEDLPWSKIDYFSRDAYINKTDLIVGVGSGLIDRFDIPKGQALVLTSVVFRAVIEASSPPPVSQYAFVPDDYFYTFDGITGFRFLIGGASPIDRVFTGSGFNAETNTWVIMNQNIAIPGHPFYMVAKERQVVEARGALTPAVASLPFFFVGVEYRGLWVPIAVYDKLRARFTAREG